MTTFMNPPVVSVAGFANVDRRLFKAVSRKTNRNLSGTTSVNFFCAVASKLNLGVTIFGKTLHFAVYTLILSQVYSGDMYITVHCCIFKPKTNAT